MFSVTRLKSTDPSLWVHVRAIREEVFVIEQSVSIEEEYDEYEESSQHYLVFLNDFPIGTARLRQTQEGVKLERFAFKKEFRNRGAGTFLLREVLEDARAFSLPVYLNAQESAINFYSRNGFEVQGDRFYEAGIPHFRMNLIC